MATRQVLWPQLPDATNGTITWASSTSSIFGGNAQIGNAVGIYMEWTRVLAPGTNTFNLFATTGTASGIWSLRLDGVEVGTIDLYSGSTAFNVKFSRSFEVGSAGTHTIRLQCIGSSGANYYALLQQAEIVSESPYYVTTDALLPGVVDVPPFAYSANSGALSLVAAASAMWGGEILTPGTAGWWVEYPVWLAAGTYILETITCLAFNRGDLEYRLDGVLLGTLDHYQPVTNRNQLISLTGLTVAESRVYTLRVSCDNKNTSSSGYYGSWNWLQFVRTSEAGLSANRGLETTELYPWMADDSSAVPTWSSNSPGVFYGHYYVTNTINNYLEWSVTLPAGTWEASILHTKNTGYGKAHLLLDGVDQGQADFYSSSFLWNQHSAIAFTVATSGLHTLRLSADSKNASSWGYYLPMQLIRLTRTGD